MDPRWDRVAQKLWVCSAVQDSHEGVDLVHNVVLFMLRWRDFSNTRWAGVGPSTRRIILSLAVGLEAMVQEVDRDGKITTVAICRPPRRAVGAGAYTHLTLPTKRIV